MQKVCNSEDSGMHTPAKKLASCSHLEVLLIGLFRVRVRVPLNGLLLGTGLLQLGAQMQPCNAS